MKIKNIMICLMAALAFYILFSCGSTDLNIHFPKNDSSLDHVTFVTNHQIGQTECMKVKRDSLIDNDGKSEWIKDSFYFFYYITFATDSSKKVLKAKNGADSISSVNKVIISKDSVLYDYMK